ncbi:MAG: citrate/2-methylcitrate synthase, partial [Nitrospinae bacterium]|nr:citrate/2-methylcitrate synthase [Nitrospinota bacterium]
MTEELKKGMAGLIVDESSISLPEGGIGKLSYRGIQIDDLAFNSTYLETAYLLLFGDLPKPEELEKFTRDVTFHTRLKVPMENAMWECAKSSHPHPMNFLQAASGMLGVFYPVDDVLDEDVRYQSVVRLVAKLPTMVAAIYRILNGDRIIAPRNDISFCANFYWMLHEKEPDPIVEKIINSLMIIHADHGFNNSTFCCRNVGSSLADIYTAITAGIGSLSGALHGGAAEEAIKMLMEIGSPENAEPYIMDKLAKKQPLSGLGHRIYKVKDPRAFVLQK